MYNIKSYDVINNTPWEIPFSQRVANMLEMKKMGLKVVCYLYERADTSTFRYRVYNMCQALEVGLTWRGVYFFDYELECIYQFINSIDVVIICRYRWNSKIDKIIDFFHENHKIVVFDTDDMVYNEKYIPNIMNTLAVPENEDRLNYWFSYINRISAVERKCDVLTTTNKYLADIMQRDLSKKVYITQNFLNRIQLEVSEAYYLQKKQQCSEGKFIIGYFSGTPSHINDFRVVAPEIKQLLEENKNIILRIVGFMEMPAYLNDLVNKGQIEYEPLVTFTELQKKIAEVNVNIAPLVVNQFTNCKSELKYFEAAIVGTPTCATPTYVFKKGIIHGEDGYLCEQGDWYDTLKNLYDNRIKENVKLNEGARQKCIEKYAYYNQTNYLENILNQITGGK